MPWLAAAGAIAGAVGSAATAAAAAAGHSGNLDPKLAQYKGPNGDSYGYQNEGLDMFTKGSNFGMNQDTATLGNQNALVGQLQQMAAGNGPSAAQGVLQQGRDAAIANAQALAGSARGNGLGGVQMAAMNAGNNATQNAANNATMLRAQEQQNAIGQLGNVLGGMRQAYGQDAQRRDQMEQFYMSLGQTREQAALNARMAMEQEADQQWNEYQRNRMGIAGHNANQESKWISGIGQGFAQLGSSAGQMGGGGQKPPSGGA